MTDIEMLELAAKAAGVMIHDWDAKGNPCLDPVEYQPWNPLKDDGDAFRLAVHLCLSLLKNGSDYGPLAWEPISSAETAACSVRRAIVAAAVKMAMNR